MRVNVSIERNRPSQIKSVLTEANIVEAMIYVTLVCNFFILLGNPLHNDTIVSLFTRILLGVVLLVGIFFVVDCFRHTVDSRTAWFAAVVISTIATGILNGINVFAGSLVSIICFLMLPVYMFAGHKVTHITRLKKSIYIANASYALLFIYLSQSPQYAYVFYGEYGKRILDDLTMGYANPNEASMYLLSVYLVLFTAFTQTQKLPKLCYGVLAAITLYLIFLANSRICIILAVLYLGIYVFRLYQRHTGIAWKIALWIPAIAVIFMLLFPTYFTEWVILGDSADNGRYFLYAGALENIDLFSFFLGNLAGYAGANLHNSYISLFMGYGAMVFSSYMVFCSKTLSHYEKGLISRESKLAFMAFLMIILHGIAEGTFLISGTVFAGLPGLMFILMREDNAAI